MVRIIVHELTVVCFHRKATSAPAPASSSPRENPNFTFFATVHRGDRVNFRARVITRKGEADSLL